MFARSSDHIALIIAVCILYCSSQFEGKPLRKRSVSEMQLMHNLGERKHVQERQDWLLMKLKDLHSTSLRNAGRRDRVRTRRLLPEDLQGLEELTPNEVEYILNLLDKLLTPR